jgi:hypothetical protein
MSTREMILGLIAGLWKPVLYGLLGIGIIKFIPRYLAYKRRISKGRL